MLDGAAHQLVVGRVEVDLVDAMAVAVMTAQHRFVLVGEKAGAHQRPTGERAVGVQPLLGPAAAEARDPLLQRHVEAVEVGPVQWRHLVGDLVGFGAGVGQHGGLLSIDRGDQMSEARSPRGLKRGFGQSARRSPLADAPRVSGDPLVAALGTTGHGATRQAQAEGEAAAGARLERCSSCPPSTLASRLLIAKPIPRPPWRRVSEPSSWRKCS